MKKFQRIGVLTSGGDAPGMNAAVRAVTRAALAHDVEVVGIYRGYSGLISRDVKMLGKRDVSNMMNHGGTVLIDHPRGKGTRVTLTLALRQNTEGSLRSPALRVDYAGERDHGLIELADCLPAELYGKE